MPCQYWLLWKLRCSWLCVQSRRSWVLIGLSIVLLMGMTSILLLSIVSVLLLGLTSVLLLSLLDCTQTWLCPVLDSIVRPNWHLLGLLRDTWLYHARGDHRYMSGGSIMHVP